MRGHGRDMLDATLAALADAEEQALAGVGLTRSEARRREAGAVREARRRRWERIVDAAPDVARITPEDAAAALERAELAARIAPGLVARRRRRAAAVRCEQTAARSPAASSDVA